MNALRMSGWLYPVAFFAAIGFVSFLVSIAAWISDMRRILRNIRDENLPPPVEDPRDSLRRFHNTNGR